MIKLLCNIIEKRNKKLSNKFNKPGINFSSIEYHQKKGNSFNYIY